MLIIGTILLSFITFVIGLFRKKKQSPQIVINDKYYGKNILKENELIPEDSEQINKFEINVDDSILEDLQQRLKTSRFVEPLVGVKFEYGFNGDKLKEVLDYWINIYDWRKQEAELNKYDHFKTKIEGIDVHFIHVKADADSSAHIVPLLIVHGWPGSVYEYYKSIPLLRSADKGLAFELIIPSIPGYGFSEAPHHPGFAAPDAARIFTKLMERLGHRQFYYHGGDWGAAIGRFLSIMYPEKVLGYHTTLISYSFTDRWTLIKLFVGYLFPSLVFENPELELKKFSPIKKIFGELLRETGYMHIQATKPDTIAVGLLNSPAGLAAYILEKFAYWVNKDFVYRADGGLTENFTYDELLTNVMIYWVTNTIGSSVRFYKETFTNISPNYSHIKAMPIPESVPIGLSIFPNEIITVPKFVVQHFYPNIIHYNHLAKGGHFAAFEEPEITVNEIREFVAKAIKLNEVKK